MLVNGISYAWADIVVTLLGRKIIGISAISWDRKHEKKNNYGGGDEPISRGRGNKEYESAITLEYKEVVGILSALDEGQDLTDIAPFEISVSFINESNKTVSLTLNDVEFTTSGLGSKSGDTSIDIELPLIISGISYKK